MDFLKELFESGAITWEQFVSAVGSKGYKLADLSKGEYVAKNKYDDAITSRDTTITELNSQIAKRDTDLKELQAKLASGDADSTTKIASLTEQLTKLQGTYDSEKQAYETKLHDMAYDSAVREYAHSKEFSSEAAKRDYLSQMKAAQLKMKDGQLIGADDFDKGYKEKNPDAYKTEQTTPPPQFIQPTPPGGPTVPEENPFLAAFGFTKN